jgi:flagellar FliL protein
MADADTSGKRDVMITMVVVLLLTLVGAGVGFAVGTLLGDSKTAEASEPAQAQGTEQASTAQEDSRTGAADEEAVQNEEAPEDFPSEDVMIAPFPPVLTTLADPKGKWIRVEGSILIRTASEKQPELLAEKAGEQILTYLRSVRLSQLESPSGILGLRDDLDETVRTLSEGDVRGVLIHGLVVE